MARSLTGSGVSVIAASPTAMTGEDAGPTRPATSSPTPSATAAASSPARAASAPALRAAVGRGDGVRGVQRRRHARYSVAGPIGMHAAIIVRGAPRPSTAAGTGGSARLGP